LDLLISENINGKALDDFGNRFKTVKFNDLWKTPATLAKTLKGAKALLVRNQTIVDKDIINSGPSLLIIARAGVGYDNIDVNYATQKGIVVCYAPDGNTISTAELTIGLMIALARKLPSAVGTTKGGSWDRLSYIGMELYNKTLGIVGFGRIGKSVAIKAHSFGMKVIVYDKYFMGGGLEGIVANVKDLKELLIASDVISIHLPSNQDTIGLFGKKIFDLIKPGALLINTSRGNIIVEDHLIQALENGRIKGASLDVRQEEPPIISKLNNMENVILTPHIGGFTTESQERVLNSIVIDIGLVLEGKPAINYINFPFPKRLNN
jgi:D-3-phosphoglycerate dehydrogenase